MTSRNTVLAGLFVGSGAAALIYQVVWMRQLTLLFGGTVYAVSTILACFMGGLALGAYGAGRWAVGLGRPVRTYALLELAIAGAGALSGPAFAAVERVVGAWVPREMTGPPDIVLRFALAVPLLLLPTVLMGATLPVLSRHVARRDEDAARSIAFLYTCNTIGAALGAAAAGYVLVPLLGLRGSVAFAVLLNAGVGATALLVLAERSTAPMVEAPAAPARAGPPSAPMWLMLGFLSGLVALALEVVWTRTLVLYLGSSVYAYASLLTVYLLGLGAGGAVAVRLLARGSRAKVLFAAAQALLALHVPIYVWQLRGLSEHLGSLNRALGIGSYGAFAFASFAVLVELLLPPTLCMGLSFPSLVAVLTQGARSAPRDLGRLYAWNTTGAIVGALATPIALIPLLGLQRALVALGSVAIGCSLVAWSDGLKMPARLASGASVPVLFAVLYAVGCPPGSVVMSAGVFARAGEPRQLVRIEEDVDATITVEDVAARPGFPHTAWRSLSVNGVNVAGTSPDLAAIQALQGHLPLLLARERGRVLHIGFGSGGTAWAVSRHPVQEIVIAEISMGVIRTSHELLANINHGVLQDPRVRVVHKDGRNYILATGPPFDVILSDSVHPRYAGNGALYTEEYYRRCRSQLRPGGVVSQWLPIYSLTPENFLSILKAFGGAFPETSIWYVNSTINAFTIVVGHTTPFAVDVPELERRLAEPDVRKDLAGAGVGDARSLLDYYVAAGEPVRRLAGMADSHVDDLPAVEYDSMRVMNRDAAWLAIFHTLRQVREPVVPKLTGASPALVAALETSFAATSKSLEGHELHIAGQPAAAVKLFEEAWKMNPDDREPVGW